jgi:hypothetical protein
MATAASRYAATAESVDFSLEAEKARRRVNGFVEDATNGLVRDVLPPGSVDSTTVVVLANALYFKGTWAQPFDQSATFTAPFHTPDGGVPRRGGGHELRLQLVPPVDPHAAGEGRLRQAVELAYEPQPRRVVQLLEGR